MKNLNKALLLLYWGIIAGICISGVGQDLPIRTSPEKVGWMPVMTLLATVSVAMFIGYQAGREDT